MELFVRPFFREESESSRENMTVSGNAGLGNRKKKGQGKGCHGVIRFKMTALKEVMKRRNQIGTLVKKRLEENIRNEESKLEAEFRMRKMEEEVKSLKQEIKELMKKADKDMGEVPEVKIRIQVKFPKRGESILLKEKEVKIQNLRKLGIPGAKSLEKAVNHVQSQLDEVREQHTSMINEVEKLVKTVKLLDQQ